MRHHRLIIWSILMLMLLLSSAISAAQPDRVLTVAVLDSMEGEALNSAIADYEADNPGIQVQVVPVEPASLLNALSFEDDDIEDYLESLADYAQSADVLYVTTNLFDPMATRSGFFLDLAPLLQADTATGSALRPAAQESFAWDGAQWALPNTMSPVGLLYNPAEFDAAGLSYPNDDWSLAAFENAARRLAITGSAETAMTNRAAGMLLVGTGDPPVTDSLPSEADFSGLRDYAQLLTELLSEGVLTTTDIPESAALIAGDAGLLVSRPEMQFAPLPGNVVGLNAHGFAVSAGTSQPQAAYDLAAHLTGYPDVSVLLAGVSARVDTERRTALFGEEGYSMIEPLLTLARPAADFRFTRQAVRNLDEIDSVQQQINQRLIAIADAASDRVIVVQPGNIRPQTASDSPSIEFYVVRYAENSSAGATWQQIAQNFTDDTGTDVTVRLSNPMGSRLDNAASNGDCFYMPGVFFAPFGDVTEFLLPVEPLAASDPMYDPSDFIVDAESTLSYEGLLMGIPYTIQPRVMAVDATAVHEAGLSVPEVDWTAEEFTSLITTLDSADYPALWIETQTVPYAPLMMLFSLYAPPPVDTATSPPTLNYNNSTTRQAIQTVLDWWREGRIAYPSLDDVEIDQTLIDNPIRSPVVVMDIDSGAFQAGGVYPGQGLQRAERPYKPLPFPAGVRTPVSYLLTGGFISAETDDPQVCYDFLSYATQQPQYFTEMPVRQSQLSDTAVEAAYGDETLAFYRAFAASVQRNNIYDVPMLDSDLPFVILVRGWLDEAVSAYLSDPQMNLGQELQRLQQIGEDFLATCPLDDFRAGLNCVREQIDPDFSL